MARRTGSYAEITGPKVREAALRLFSQHGYAAVSMRQIARDVGIQAGALYLYTPDKQTLLFDLLKDHMTELMGAWDADGATEDPAQELERFVKFHIGFHLDRPAEVFLAYMELRNLSAENFAEIADLRRSYEEILENILQEGADQGHFRIHDLRLSTLAIIAMLTGVTTWYREKGRLPRAAVADVYWEMVKGTVGL